MHLQVAIANAWNDEEFAQFLAIIDISNEIPTIAKRSDCSIPSNCCKCKQANNLSQCEAFDIHGLAAHC